MEGRSNQQGWTTQKWGTWAEGKACCPLLSPLPPSLPSLFPSSHTSHCQWLEAKWKKKKKSIYYRPFTLIYHWIVCLHSQNPTKWFSFVMWFTCILKLHATPSRSQRHKCVLSLTEQAQLKQIKSKMHILRWGSANVRDGRKAAAILFWSIIDNSRSKN